MTTSKRQLNRALDEFRRGEAVRLVEGNEAWDAYAFPRPAPARAVESAARARHLGLPEPKHSPLEAAALMLARRAGLLPAVWLEPAADPEALALDIRHIAEIPEFSLASQPEVQLPLADAPDARARVFSDAEGHDHVAVLVGKPGEAPLTRVHSSCFTGDILGSLRCDCGEQLHEALKRMAAHGGGVLLYVNQEGRGIGLKHKLHAYRLQEQGLDTAAANEALGFEVDERDFTVAAAMLKMLGVNRIRLLTNNPEKQKQIEALGITVAERVPLVIPAGEHNKAYLEAKARKLGHQF